MGLSFTDYQMLSIVWILAGVWCSVKEQEKWHQLMPPESVDWKSREAMELGLLLTDLAWGFPFIKLFGDKHFYTSIRVKLKIHKTNSWCRNTYPGRFVTRSSGFSRLVRKPLKCCQSKRSGVFCVEMMAGTWEKHRICGWNVCCQGRQ